MYKAAIRKNDTGEIRIAEIEWDWYKNGEEGDLYWWTEGNFSCDCNRELQWLYAGKESDIDMDDSKCSKGRYSVLYVELPDGTKIEIDTPEKS